MKRSPCVWTKLDKETGEKQEDKMTEMEWGESQEECESQEEGISQEEGESQEELDTDGNVL